MKRLERKHLKEDELTHTLRVAREFVEPRQQMLKNVGIAAVAERLGAGFIPIRKPGKLPAKAIKETYDLEYGKDALEIHEDAVDKGQKVLIVDDVLATGGTAAAAAGLVKRTGGQLTGLAFLIELLFLQGKAKLNGENVYSVLQY